MFPLITATKVITLSTTGSSLHCCSTGCWGQRFAIAEAVLQIMDKCSMIPVHDPLQ